jgi:hypothetical protein
MLRSTLSWQSTSYFLPFGAHRTLNIAQQTLFVDSETEFVLVDEPFRLFCDDNTAVTLKLDAERALRTRYHRSALIDVLAKAAVGAHGSLSVLNLLIALSG